jgi:Kef-type K+ transport system membrane component KefB
VIPSRKLSTARSYAQRSHPGRSSERLAPVPGLDYTDLAIAVAAATAAPLAVELLPVPKVPPIVTEIAAGIAIGPQLLDIVEVTAPLEVFSQIGLVFLFFLAGLEIAFDASGERHLRLVGAAFLVSFCIAVLAALAFEAAELAGAPLLVAIVLAATSFGIVVAVLKDAGQTGTPFGQLVIAGASIADFATVILLSLFFSHQGSGAESTAVLLLLFGGLVAAVGLLLAGARGSGRLDRDKAVVSSGLQAKLEGIGFGVFIPVFFVVSGVQLDLGSLFGSFDTAVLVPATVLALLLVRGLPALLYGRIMERREAIAAGLLQATSLSFVVAATQIGVELGKLDEAAAAGLVAGGVISVLVFPALARRILGRETA